MKREPRPQDRRPPQRRVPDDPTEAGRAAGRKAPVMTNNTGRVTHDERGIAIWEWAGAQGALTSEIASERLRKLDNSKLGLAEDAPTPSNVVKRNPLGTVRGYSPYDSGLLERKKTNAKKKDLRRLSEWMKLKKQAEKNKAGRK